jgi:hypothetical protein
MPAAPAAGTVTTVTGPMYTKSTRPNILRKTGKKPNKSQKNQKFLSKAENPCNFKDCRVFVFERTIFCDLSSID